MATDQAADGFDLWFASVTMALSNGTVWLEDNDSRDAVAVLEFRFAEGAPVRRAV